MSVTLSPNAQATVSQADIDRRISFIENDQILDIDLSDLTLENSADANVLYDRLEARIAGTEEPL